MARPGGFGSLADVWVALTAEAHDPSPRPEPDLIADILERLTALESRVPKPRFSLPPNWVSPKDASALTGFSLPAIYKWTRTGKIVSAKVGGRVAIDPISLMRKRIPPKP